ncbi:hypothetical protein ABW19_dt0204258 [Dactylella cylindrospora]|nr:hypothetical protein ABW19_dt0204258 [Dactylella cylindrospora]
MLTPNFKFREKPVKRSKEPLLPMAVISLTTTGYHPLPSTRSIGEPVPTGFKASAGFRSTSKDVCSQVILDATIPLNSESHITPASYSKLIIGPQLKIPGTTNGLRATSRSAIRLVRYSHFPADTIPALISISRFPFRKNFRSKGFARFNKLKWNHTL